MIVTVACVMSLCQCAHVMSLCQCAHVMLLCQCAYVMLLCQCAHVLQCRYVSVLNDQCVCVMILISYIPQPLLKYLSMSLCINILDFEITHKSSYGFGNNLYVSVVAKHKFHQP